MAKRILILAGSCKSLINFRGAFINSMCEQGHIVEVAAPNINDNISNLNLLSDLGVEYHDIALKRANINPFYDFVTFFSIVRLLKKNNPDLLFCYTIKPVIYGAFASSLSNVPRCVVLITGLGYAFTGDATGKRALVKLIVRGLYKFALRRSSLIFFQNPDDRDDFAKMGLLPKEVPVVIVNGSGVDLDVFKPAPFPQTPLRFLLIARLLGDKGIREFVSAANIVKATHPTIEFHLVGGVDSNPDSISEAEVRSWHESGDIKWHGALDDVRHVIANSHVYVLPSYREGTPRTVLEAMAMGRPIITTNSPGCRETVVNGYNGFLVPVRSVESLVNVMNYFIDKPELVSEMGARSFQIAKNKYDVHKVNAKMFKAMELDVETFN
ncbi:MAG: glycosyltransferase family 4 protein [Moraxellaceae bacterium]|nr:glycosyltransferase family 4 protein [Moraxellaceae bacterium]MDZ4386020.1 glycosyltransferase family 4 protein [Moraxellaceae bacterium]